MIKSLKWIQMMVGCMVAVYAVSVVADLARIALRGIDHCGLGSNFTADLNHSLLAILGTALYLHFQRFFNDSKLALRQTNWNNIASEHLPARLVMPVLAIGTTLLVILVSIDRFPRIWSHTGVDTAYAAYYLGNLELAE